MFDQLLDAAEKRRRCRAIQYAVVSGKVYVNSGLHLQLVAYHYRPRRDSSNSKDHALWRVKNSLKPIDSGCA